MTQHAEGLSLWVVYRYPLDFPRHYAVRRQWVVPGILEPVRDPVACLYDNVEEAMFDCEAKGLMFLERHAQDDPVIVGTWV